MEVIERGDPAFMVCHWTGTYWNGRETGFQVFQEVVRRLRARFDNLLWMKLSEAARYWAARELTAIESGDHTLTFRAPFACPDFTLAWAAPGPGGGRVSLRVGTTVTELREVSSPLRLETATFHRHNGRMIACFRLPKGNSRLQYA